jgi:pyridoxine kinase
MFAALMLVRFREAVNDIPGLMETDAWVSGDGVGATELPLARATEKVLASMHEVLSRTKERRDEEMEMWANRVGTSAEEDEKKLRLVKSKAAEVRLVRNLGALKNPEVKFRAEEV